jgi:flagellar capping protein FliD
MVNSVDGILTQRGKTLDSKIELQQKQISRIDEQLARKRASLEKQFTAMEQALAQLSSQQSALQSLSTLG